MSIAVDFAKHGECVSKEEFQHLAAKLENWPDFFEKPFDVTRESRSILGLLYRDICNDKALQDFLKNDYRFSIMR